MILYKLLYEKKSVIIVFCFSLLFHLHVIPPPCHQPFIPPLLLHWKWKSLSLVQLFGSMDRSPPRSSVHGVLKSTGVGCHFLLQDVFLTQGLNPGSCLAGRFFTIWATREALVLISFAFSPIISLFNFTTLI